ncbi:unnamed protein product [marine sediment metagenome]|uniref:Uncharacterized protein n=1 Tax=marine sediment metagenome TaxID=412755 RepID=X1KPW3_9ZZZZ
MSNQDVLDYIDAVMEEHDLRPNQQIDTLMQAIEDDQGEDNPSDDSGSDED